MPSIKENILWSVAGSFTYAACQWGMIVLLAKLGRSELVGQYTLSLAIAAPVFHFTNLQLRVIQASDVAGSFPFGAYLGNRLLMSSFAWLTVSAAVLASGFTRPLLLVTFAVGGAKAAESLGDIFYGLLQKHSQLSLIAKSMMIKGGLALLGIALGLTVIQSTAVGVTLVAIGWLALCLSYDLRNGRSVLSRYEPGTELMPCFRFAEQKQMLTLAFPMAVVIMINSVAVNMPRYFLAASHGESAVGYYSAIFYASVAVSLITNAICTTLLPRLASSYKETDGQFERLIVRALAYIWLFSFAGVVSALLVGDVALSIVYGPSYAQFRMPLVLVMVGVGFSNSSALVGTAVTAARSFWPQVVAAAAFALSAAGVSALAIPGLGVMGGAIAYTIAAGVQLAVITWRLAQVWPSRVGERRANVRVEESR